MAGFRSILRFFLLYSHRSKVHTAITPLSEIESAVVLRTPGEYSLDRVIIDFFKDRNINLRLISKEDDDLRTNEDLFISLLAEPDIDELYAAVSSTAKFKIGIHKLRRDVYNVIVTVTSDGDARQVAIFNTIADILTKIK